MGTTTWNDSNSKLAKEASIYNDFTYDTETDGGILTKLDEINGIINDIDTNVKTISDNYTKLQGFYDKFTDYNESMDTNKQQLTSSVNSIKNGYTNILKQLESGVLDFQSNDSSFMADLTCIQQLLGRAGGNTTTTNNTPHGKPTNQQASSQPSTQTNTEYEPKHANEKYFDDVMNALIESGLTKEEAAKLADAIFDATRGKSLKLLGFKANAIEALVLHYDGIMASLGDDGIGIMNKLLTNTIDGLEFNLPKELLDNFMHDEGMTQLLLDASGGDFDLANTKDYLKALTNFANNNDISYDSMNNMVKGFDTFLTNQVNANVGDMLGVTFTTDNMEDIYNCLINYYDYKDVPVSLTDPNSLAQRTEAHNQLAYAILDAIPDKQAAVENLLANAFKVSGVDLTDVDCERLLKKAIRNSDDIAESIGILQGLENNETGFAYIGQNIENGKTMYEEASNLLSYMGINSDVIGTVAYNQLLRNFVESADEIIDDLFGWL